MSHSRFDTQFRHDSPKVAIPRLHQRNTIHHSESPAANNNRVVHACEPCRRRKTKCSGELPACKHCEDFKLDCSYEDGKRDRARKQMGSMARRLATYEELLRHLSFDANEHDRGRIHKALERDYSPDSRTSSSIISSGSQSDRTEKNHSEDSPYGENNVSARVGSTEALDKVEEDLDRNSATQATGYHGKNSELTWLQRLRLQTSDSEESDDSCSTKPRSRSFQNGVFGSEVPPISDSTYHCDDLSVLIAERVNALDLPSRHVADALLQIFFDTIPFPILDQPLFTSQYQAFGEGNLKAGNDWRAILNMIFAVAAKYAQLVQADWKGDARDHLIYFTRSRMLGFNSDAIFSHAEMQKVQIAGLMAFYLMMTNQISRSWVISGIAIRHASTLGFNLKNDSKELSAISKRIRNRLWWSLCSIEQALAVMTGRPTSFLDNDCTTPLPYPGEVNDTVNAANIPILKHNCEALYMWNHSQAFEVSRLPRSLTSQNFRQEQKPVSSPSQALYFFHHIKLSILTNNVLGRLYRASAMEHSWAETQSTIDDLDQRLNKWRLELPHDFDFTNTSSDQQWIRQRISLGFFFFSTMILIYRPCLCRVDRNIPNESSKAMEIDRSVAAKCVHAARDMLGLLPQEPNPILVYRIGPWWTLVHHLMQASTVLMLELSFRADHMSDEVEEVLDAAKKVLQWLGSMKDENESARRAWTLSSGMLQKLILKLGRAAGSVPTNEEWHDHAGAANPYRPSSPSPFRMFTLYDEYLVDSYSAMLSKEVPTRSLFPTASAMDAMTLDELESPEQDSETFQNQQCNFN